MKEKEMICIMCPRGCHLTVSQDLVVDGNFCPRGKAYGISEMTHPVRILTTTVKTDQKETPRLSVKSNKGIPKEDIFNAMAELSHITVNGHVKIGDVVLANICNSGADIIATKNI